MVGTLWNPFISLVTFNHYPPFLDSRYNIEIEIPFTGTVNIINSNCNII